MNQPVPPPFNEVRFVNNVGVVLATADRDGAASVHPLKVADHDGRAIQTFRELRAEMVAQVLDNAPSVTELIRSSKISGSTFLRAGIICGGEEFLRRVLDVEGGQELLDAASSDFEESSEQTE